jgi:hypothetical protein
MLSGQGLLLPLPTVEDAVRRCVCVQTQYAQSLPVAMAARTPPKPPAYFAEALDEDGPLRKTWTVRWTLHTVHEDDIPLFVSSVGRHFHQRYLKGTAKYLGVDESMLVERERKIWESLQRGPLSRKQLHDCVPELKGLPGAGWGWDVAGLAYEGKLYACSHMGATRFVACDPPAPVPVHEAQAQLLERYLAAYGPATKTDFKYWTGLYMADVRRAFATLEPKLEWRQLENRAEPYAVLSGRTLPDGRPKLRLLAKFDPYVMAHRDKRHFLPEKWHKEVFRPAGQVEASVLRNGIIVGTWRAERIAKRIRLNFRMFERVSKGQLGELEREADKVRIAFGAESVEMAGLADHGNASN